MAGIAFLFGQSVLCLYLRREYGAFPGKVPTLTSDKSRKAGKSISSNNISEKNLLGIYENPY